MDTDIVQSRRRGYLIALVSTIIWSSSAVLVGYLTTNFHTPPLVVAFWRAVFVAGVLFGVLSLGARPLLHLESRHRLFMILYGLVLAVLSSLFTFSVALNGAAVATVLIYSSPAFTALMERILWGERVGTLKICALFLSIAGCTFVSGAYDWAVWQVNPTGILVGLVSGLAFAVYSLLGKVSSRRRVNPWTATAYVFLFSSAFLLLVQRRGTILWLSQPLADGPAGRSEAALGWATVALLAIGPSIGGNGLYTVSLTHLSAATANLIITLEPALTAVWAFFFLGERLTGVELFGAGLILAGVAFVYLSDRSDWALKT